VGIDEQEALGEWHPGESDAGQLAHAAVRPVAPHEPADPALAAVGESNRDTVRILFSRSHLAAPYDLTAQFGDAPPEPTRQRQSGRSRTGDQHVGFGLHHDALPPDRDEPSRVPERHPRPNWQPSTPTGALPGQVLVAGQADLARLPVMS
jgi:hypothetical protein